MNKEEYLNIKFLVNKLLNKKEKNCVKNIKFMKWRIMKLLFNQKTEEKYSLIEDHP